MTARAGRTRQIAGVARCRNFCRERAGLVSGTRVDPLDRHGDSCVCLLGESGVGGLLFRRWFGLLLGVASRGIESDGNQPPLARRVDQQSASRGLARLAPDYTTGECVRGHPNVQPDDGLGLGSSAFGSGIGGSVVVSTGAYLRAGGTSLGANTARASARDPRVLGQYCRKSGGRLVSGRAELGFVSTGVVVRRGGAAGGALGSDQK